MLIDRSYDSCQSQYREIRSVEVDPSSSSVETRRSRELRGLQNEDLVEVRLVLQGGCDQCDENESFFSPSVLNEDDFEVAYSEIAETPLDFFSEVVSIDCPTDFSTFDDLVIVEFVGDCESLINDVELIASARRSVRNDIQFSDPRLL